MNQLVEHDSTSESLLDQIDALNKKLAAVSATSNKLHYEVNEFRIRCDEAIREKEQA